MKEQKYYLGKDGVGGSLSPYFQKQFEELWKSTYSLNNWPKQTKKEHKEQK